jgi:hypothetical protein
MCGQLKKRKRFFLKKEAKTFATGAAQECGKARDEVGAVAKVFWFFFSKKNRFLTDSSTASTNPAP